MKKICYVVLVVLLMLQVVACNNAGQTKKEKEVLSLLEGTWYLAETQEIAFTLRDDGACDFGEENGTGTWCLVSDEQLVFTSYYGETKITTINELTNEKMVLQYDGITEILYREEYILTIDENELLSQEGIQEQQENVNASVELTSGTTFSDGIAWVKYETQTGDEKIGLINTKGEITPLTLEEITRKFGSEFSGGYAYAEYEDKSNSAETFQQFVIIDSSGCVVGRSPKNGNYKVLAGGDGLFLVQQNVRNMTTNEERLGIIDIHGDWVCEPTVNGILSLSDEQRAKYEKGKTEIIYSYHGESVFSAFYNNDSRYYDDYLCFYNADTGIAAGYENMMIASGGFFNGKAITVTSDKNKIYCIHNDLTIIQIIDLEDSLYGRSVYYQDGIIFIGESYKHDNWGTWCYKNGMFYNIDGSLLVDLSHYILVNSDADGLYCYENGYAAIIVYGEDGCSYLGIIDTDGNFVAEPLKLPNYLNHDSVGIYSCNVVPAYVDRNIDGKSYSTIVLFTLTGDIIDTDYWQDKDNVGTLKFADGLAWLEENKQYIDTKGNVFNVTLKN